MKLNLLPAMTKEQLKLKEPELIFEYCNIFRESMALRLYIIIKLKQAYDPSQ